MKTTLVLLSALAFATIFDAECVKQKQQVDCSHYEKLPPGEQRFCYAVYEPICGTDGKTYTNDCFFCSKVKETDDKLQFAHFGKC
ncbi:serine protease inhibitor Kazal-type 9 [Ochotona princeps]|uniref:serine protease inhibitor Kazal-type 9 n=1 Tax=Ochotona princeps TaxID=9978 RepID=UPI002714F6D5|nr:serine protease inhibitor Kazal-type 9 [Ochotona princeps]